MGSVADRVYIDGAHATLNVAKAGTLWMFAPEQIRHKRLHTGDVEHYARASVADKRHRADIDVVLAFIKSKPFLS